jgi:Domain of unknown function (DUF1330)
MPAYAFAHLRTPHIYDEVLEYNERIQATLDPYSGRFLVHGAEVDVKEGPGPAPSSSSSSPTSAPPRPGTTRPPTRRSCRYAPTTSTVRP